MSPWTTQGSPNWLFPCFLWSPAICPTASSFSTLQPEIFLKYFVFWCSIFFQHFLRQNWQNIWNLISWMGNTSTWFKTLKNVYIQSYRGKSLAPIPTPNHLVLPNHLPSSSSQVEALPSGFLIQTHQQEYTLAFLPFPPKRWHSAHPVFTDSTSTWQACSFFFMQHGIPLCRRIDCNTPLAMDSLAVSSLSLFLKALPWMTSHLCHFSCMRQYADRSCQMHLPQAI